MGSKILVFLLALFCSALEARILGPEDGRTFTENELLRGAVGVVNCRDLRGQVKVSTGVLIDSSDHVTTTLHSFVEIQLETCMFKNFKGQESAFKVSAADRQRIESYSQGAPMGSDQIRVALESPIDSQFLESDHSSVVEGEEFIGVTAYEDDFSSGQIQRPIVRRATVSNIQYNADAQEVGFLSDADFSHGGSGGVNLFRRAGRLVAKGLFQGLSTGAIKDYEAFDPNRNFILSTTLD